MLICGLNLKRGYSSCVEIFMKCKRRVETRILQEVYIQNRLIWNQIHITCAASCDKGYLNFEHPDLLIHAINMHYTMKGTHNIQLTRTFWYCIYCASNSELVYKPDFTCTKYILHMLSVLEHVSAHHTHHHQGAMYTFLSLKTFLAGHHKIWKDIITTTPILHS
jgi:hypothetical protein